MGVQTQALGDSAGQPQGRSHWPGSCLLPGVLSSVAIRPLAATAAHCLGATENRKGKVLHIRPRPFLCPAALGGQGGVIPILLPTPGSETPAVPWALTNGLVG